MRINHLALHHFRNISHLELQTEGNVHIFIGANAQGKTNLVESIYALALGRSHRTHKDRDLIQWNESGAKISGKIERRNGPITMELSFTDHGKKAKINGLEQRKLSDYIGALNVVLFAPEDLEIVKGSPGVRRKFMDMELAQVQPLYLHHLLQYQRIVQQKNNMLKQSNISSDMLDVWNEQLAANGVKIIKSRQHFIRKLERWAESIHDGITAGGETLKVEYKPSFDADENEDETVLMNQFMIKLSQNREQEMRRGMCLIGPHRDDLAFEINGKDVLAYGSQGQQRTTALSLKLAEIELIREEVGEYPILLLDDVLSELDRTRQTKLIDTFQGKVQTFVTTTSIDGIEANTLTEAKMLIVQDGQIIE